MEPLYFDAQTGWFLGSRTHKGRIPDHARRITGKRHAAMIAERDATPGAEIVGDANGKPILRLPNAEARQVPLLKAIKQEAGRRIERIFPAMAQMNAIRSGNIDDPRFAAIDAIRAASNLIEQDVRSSEAPDSFPVDDHPLWPEAQA